MQDYTKSEKILVDLGISNPNDINLEIIAWSQGVKINRRPLYGCEAWIIGNKENAIISINSESSLNQQRFSIAHELGHWQYDRGTSFICSSDDVRLSFNNSRFKEEQANNFAADLLIPNYLLKPCINRISTLTWNEIKGIARIFRTSLTAAAIRIIDTNDFPVILAVYVNGKRKWFRRSEQLPQKWFPNDIIGIPQSIKDKDDEQYPVSSNFWFDQYNKTDIEVIEQTFQHNETILSLITIEDEQMRELY